jgi:hypothetical protein
MCPFIIGQITDLKESFYSETKAPENADEWGIGFLFLKD